MEVDSHFSLQRTASPGLEVPHHIPSPPHHLQRNCCCCCSPVKTEKTREERLLPLFKLKCQMFPVDKCLLYTVGSNNTVRWSAATYFIFKGHSLFPSTELVVDAINAGHHRRVFIPAQRVDSRQRRHFIIAEAEKEKERKQKESNDSAVGLVWCNKKLMTLMKMKNRNWVSLAGKYIIKSL